MPFRAWIACVLAVSDNFATNGGGDQECIGDVESWLLLLRVEIRVIFLFDWLAAWDAAHNRRFNHLAWFPKRGFA